MALANTRYNLRNTFFADSRVRTLETLALMPDHRRDGAGQHAAQCHRQAVAGRFLSAAVPGRVRQPGNHPRAGCEALAQFLRTLVSYRARFDQVYPEDGSTFFPQSSPWMTPLENEGVVVYVNAGCGHCHKDVVFAVEDTASNGLDELPTDQGGFEGKFRVASLRNIRRSAPYMHDGRFATLREVIDHYDSGIKMSANLSGLLRTANQREHAAST